MKGSVKSGTMRTVYAAQSMNCRLAYNINKGKYDENYYMISNKGVYKVSDTDELRGFLDELDRVEAKLEEQLTLKEKLSEKII